MNVLVVDDSSTMRRIIINSLDKLHFGNVTEAGDGREGLGKLTPETGLIVTDWNMPEMNGLEFIKAVRADPNYRTVPIIMVTTEAGKAEIVEAIKNGVNNYIVKPFTIDVLKEKIQAVLGVQLGA
ncbi:MAG: response regulator [Verrucomicrobia bacterium]|nr:response regulator [Verrucomicrobiota bacterium]